MYYKSKMLILYKSVCRELNHFDLVVFTHASNSMLVFTRVLIINKHLTSNMRKQKYNFDNSNSLIKSLISLLKYITE